MCVSEGSMDLYTKGLFRSTLLNFYGLVLVTAMAISLSSELGISTDNTLSFNEEMEPEVWGDNWREFDDRMEAEEEEYSRSRRQTIVTRHDQDNKDSSCPGKCTCTSTHEVHCTFHFLSKIPEDLPSNIEKLNLGYNKLSVLPTHSFDSCSATLRVLYLHSNDIRSLNNGVFAKLNKVEVLRLSWNKITGIRKIALHGLHSVERLHLDNNRLSFIHPLALRGLVNLKLLQLDGNRLARLHRDVFVTVEFEKYFKFSSIQYLYLSKNLFSHLPRQIFDHMQNLKNVYLHGNKWECSCDIKWLKKWIDDEDKYRCKSNAWNSRAPQECAVCSWPPNLAGIRLQDMLLDNLTCEAPKIISKNTESLLNSNFMDIHDAEEMSRHDEVILFRYSDFYSTRMNIRLDSHKRSVFHANCHLTRVPNVKVQEVYKDSSNKDSQLPSQSSTRSYVGNFEAVMECSIEYPENVTALQNIMKSYLDQEMNFTSRGSRARNVGKHQSVYSISVSKLSGSSPATPITGGSISSESSFIRSPESHVTFQSRQFSAEEGTLYLLYQTTFTHTYEHELGKYTKKPWVLIKNPDGTVLSVDITLEKKTSTFRCKAVGQPKPNITWILPDEQVLRAGQSSGRFSVSKSGRLLIRRSVPADSGIYRCMATVPEPTEPDFTGLPSSAEAEMSTIRIVVFPRIEGSSEETRNEISNLPRQTVEEGDNWSSECNTQGLPNSTVGWITPDYQLLVGQGKSRSGRVATTAKGRISVKNFDRVDKGVYRCIAANSVGTAEYSVYVGLEEIDDEEDGIETVVIPDIVLTPDIILNGRGDLESIPPPILQSMLDPQLHHTKVKVAPTSDRQTDHGLNKDPETPHIVLQSPDDQKIAPSFDNISNDDEEMISLPPPIVQPILEAQARQLAVKTTTKIITSTPQIKLDQDSRPEIPPTSNKSSEEQRVIVTIPIVVPIIDKRNQTLDIMPVFEPLEISLVQQNIVEKEIPETLPTSTTIRPEVEFKNNQNASLSKAYQDLKELKNIETESEDFEVENNKSTQPSPTSSSPVYELTLATTTTSGVREPPILRPEKNEVKELNISMIQVPCGESISIPCSLVPRYTPSAIQWIIPDKSIIPASSVRNNGILLVYKNGTLRIRSATPHNHGAYRCEAKDPRDTAYMMAHVTVECSSSGIVKPTESELDATVTSEKPSFKPGLASSASALIGLTARLDCAAEGTPEPDYKWYFPNGSLINLHDSAFLDRNGSLFIVNVDPGLAGEYRCVATNEFGSIQKTVNLVVTEPPTHLITGTEPDLEISIIDEIDIDDKHRSQPKVTTERAIEPQFLPTPDSKYTNFVKTPKTFPRTSVHVTRVIRQQNLDAFAPVATQEDILPTTTDDIATTDRPANNTVESKKEIVTDLDEPIPLIKPKTGGKTPSKSDVIDSSDVIDFRKPTKSTRDVIYSRETPARRIAVPQRASRLSRRRHRHNAVLSDSPFVRPAYRRKNVIEYTLTQQGMQGSQVYLQCKTTTHRIRTQTHRNHNAYMPKMSWTLPSGRVFDGSFQTMLPGWKYFLYGNGTLVIRFLNQGDAGQYKCVLDTENADIVTSVSLIVRTFPPYILEAASQFVQLKPDESVLLPCTARGHPAPGITWMTPLGTSIKPGAWRQRLAALHNGTLALYDVRVEDAGWYSCIATNVAGEVRRRVHVLVTSFPPHFMHPRSRIKYVKEGGNLRISCSASGSPSPTISWMLPNSETISANQGNMNSPKIALIASGTLLINRAERSDEGRYYCTAENTLGRDTSLVIVRVFK